MDSFFFPAAGFSSVIPSEAEESRGNDFFFFPATRCLLSFKFTAARVKWCFFLHDRLVSYTCFPQEAGKVSNAKNERLTIED